MFIGINRIKTAHYIGFLLLRQCPRRMLLQSLVFALTLLVLNPAVFGQSVGVRKPGLDPEFYLHLRSVQKLAALGSGAFEQRESNSVIMSVSDFGARCDSASDDSAAFQQAINSLHSGGTISIPPGVCRINHNVVVSRDNVTFRGSGLGATLLVAGPEVTRLFEVRPAKEGSQVVFPEFRDFSVNGRKSPDFAAFYFRSVRYAFLNRIFTTNCFISYWIDRPTASGSALTSTFHLSEFQIDDTPDLPGARGILVNGGGDDWFISNGRIYQNAQSKSNVGIEIRNGAGFMIDNVDISMLGKSFMIDPHRGESVKFGQIEALQCDTSWGDTAVLDGSAAFASGYPNGIYDIHFVNCWFSSAGVAGSDGNGLRITSAQGILIEASQFYSNTLNGIVLEKDASSISLVNNQLSGNSNGYGNKDRNKNKYSGISVEDGVKSFSVIGNRSGRQAYYVNSQQFGIKIGADCSNYRIIGNDLNENLSAAYADRSQATARDVEIGFNSPSEVPAVSGSAAVFKQSAASPEFHLIPKSSKELGNVSAPVGTIVYCSDCSPDPSCKAGGSGAIAVKQNAKWVCK